MIRPGIIKRVKIEPALFQAIIIYLLLALVLLPYFRYQLNPDGISYIGIAQKYYSFQLEDAVNGYWGPLLSWLMIPIFVMGFNSLISANILLLIIGLLVIMQSYFLIKRITFDLCLHVLIIDVIVILVVFFVYRAISPDLLFILFCLVFLNLMMKGVMLHNRYAGIFLGITGAGLYFTKNFGLPFFAAIFLAYTILYYYATVEKQLRARVLKNFISGMIIFIALSGVWVLLISQKYGHLVIGTAGDFNRAMQVPNSLVHPVYHYGLIEPPNATATSIWEDVSYLEVESWHIFDSSATMLYEIKIVLRNVIEILSILTMFSVFAVPFLFAICFYLVKKGLKSLSEDLTSLVLILFVLFSGYSLIAVDPRYIWLSSVIILIGGVKLLAILHEKVKFGKISYIIIVGAFCSSFLYMPVRDTMTALNSGKFLFEMKEKLIPYSVSGKIASDTNWEISMYLSFLNGWRYYGMNGELPDSTIDKELKDYNIDYYLVWDTDSSQTDFPGKYPEITGGKINGIEIYRLH